MKNTEKLLANNKKARHEYYLDKEIEAGIVLTGPEVKSIKAGKVSINEAYIQEKNGEMFIFGMHVTPYAEGSYNNEDPLRVRKLLLNKKEINKMAAKTQEEGNTIVPVRVVVRNGLIKIDIANAKGKNLYDKRETLKRKDEKKRIKNAMRDFNG